MYPSMARWKGVPSKCPYLTSARNRAAPRGAVRGVTMIRISPNVPRHDTNTSEGASVAAASAAFFFPPPQPLTSVTQQQQKANRTWRRMVGGGEGR